MSYNNCELQNNTNYNLNKKQEFNKYKSNKKNYKNNNKHVNIKHLPNNNEYKNIELTLDNSLNKISFCDKECFNINNNQTKGNIVSYIQSKYQIKIIDREYVTLNPHMLRNISNHEHYLATYTNGNPYLLWFTKIDGKNCAIFIDRKLKDGYSYPKIHLVQYNFDDHIFETDMLLTGELVRDINREWCYLISDLIIYEGENITTTKNILSRFNLLYNILDKYYKPDINIESCPIFIKKLWQYSDIDKFINNYLPSLSYICKGIVFYTMNNQFSNYALIIPKELQIRVKNANEADIDFYKKYPQYKDIGESTLSRNNNIDTNINNNISYSNYLLTNKSNDIISKIGNLNINYFIDKSFTINTLKKIEKCIKHFCEEQNDNLEDNIIYKEFNIIKSDLPGVYKCLNISTLNDEGLLYIPYIELEKYIYSLFIDEEQKMKIEFIKTICIYYEIFDKWVPIAYY
jgi:hypothetical protein